MKLVHKILLAIFLVSGLAISTTTFIYYKLVEKRLIELFDTRYNSLGDSISSSFIEMDKLSDIINFNAVKAFSIIEQYQGLPPNEQLDKLAKSLGIEGLYVLDKQGMFIRSSDLPLKLQKNSLFSYCKGYRNLLYGSLKYQVTPIVPGYPYNIPAKFVMIPNHNSTLILEGGYNLKFIEEILLKTIKNNKDIMAIGVFAPNNYELGYIDNTGRFEQGRSGVKISSINNNEKIFKYKIPANTKDCCECTVKKTQYSGGDYYYTLVIKVSNQSLIKELYSLKIKFILIFVIMLFAAFIVSHIIASKIAKRLAEINNSMNNIVETGNLSNNLIVLKSDKANKDEIESLAVSFNHMIEQLKLYQEHAKNNAIAEISSKIVHDIKSPLIVLDTVANKIASHLSDNNVSLLKAAIRDIKALSETLLNTYRKHTVTNSKEILPEAPKQPGYITLSSIVNGLATTKTIEWESNSINLSVYIEGNCTFSWIKVFPVDFRAMLSNLLNNAYEALDKAEKIISISLTSDDNLYKLNISDNGMGIDKDKLSAVRHGESLKHVGKGLGLSEAIKYIETTLHGSLDITSEISKGTTITITLPQSIPPSWFNSRIKVTTTTQIFVLDDDNSIIKYWKQRFSDLGIQGNFFTSVPEFLSYYEQHKSAPDKLFLIDFELSANLTGLELIRSQLFRERNIYLVTTHAEEYWIQQDIESLPIYMVPKAHISDIKIIIS